MKWFRRKPQPALITDPRVWDRDSIVRLVNLMVDLPERVEYGTALKTIAHALQVLLREKAL